jgi:hypothetical protein
MNCRQHGVQIMASAANGGSVVLSPAVLTGLGPNHLLVACISDLESTNVSSVERDAGGCIMAAFDVLAHNRNLPLIFGSNCFRLEALGSL